MFGAQDQGTFVQPDLGDQMRGFGFFHNGANAILELPQVLLGSPTVMMGVPDIDAYLLTFPTGLAPIVGQQVSGTPATVGDPAALARRDLLVVRADAGDCDLVVQSSTLAGSASGALYLGAGEFARDRAAAAHPTTSELWAEAGAAGSTQVWTCVPPGSGTRMAIDRDGDGFLDGDERDAGASPVDPVSRPGGPAVITIGTSVLSMQDGAPERRRFTFKAPRHSTIVPPPAGGSGDPTLTGATLRVYSSAGSGEQLTVTLPTTGWRAGSSGFKYRSRDGAISALRIGPGRLTIAGGGGAFTYTLDEPAQRRVVVRLTIGTGADWCAEAVASAPGARDQVGRFEVRDGAPSVDCPAPPAG
jgi:hypothetical protein